MSKTTRQDILNVIQVYAEQHLEPGDFLKSRDISDGTGLSPATIGRNIERAFTQLDGLTVNYYSGSSEDNVWLVEDNTDGMVIESKEKLCETHLVQVLADSVTLKFLTALSTNYLTSREDVSEQVDVSEPDLVLAANKLTFHTLIRETEEDNNTYYRLTERGKLLCETLAELSKNLDPDDVG